VRFEAGIPFESAYVFSGARPTVMNAVRRSWVIIDGMMGLETIASELRGPRSPHFA
jgi:hypothetical protein